jgi:hypothetical protein
MSLTTVIILNVVLDLAIVSALAYTLHLPRRLRAHHQHAHAVNGRFEQAREQGYERQAA